MTDTIRSTIHLEKLSPIARQSIPAKLCTTRTPIGRVVEDYSKPNHEKSPMSGTGMQWIARCEIDPRCPELGPLPVRIDMDVSIPNAVVGHNVQHGTSVYAAGRAALGLLRILLASHGVPRYELDQLGVEDVSLRGVTLTYLILCASVAEAERLIAMIRDTGKVLVSGYRYEESTNVTITLPDREYGVQAYIKSLLEHCKWPDNAPVAELLAPMPRIVRIEARVGQRFLAPQKPKGRANQKSERQGLTALADWKDAYATGVYERLFNETVRDVLRLDDGLRNRAPREEVYRSLTTTEVEMLRWYMTGGNPRLFPSVTNSLDPSKRFSAMARTILKKAQVDLDIPWVLHSQLHCRELAKILHYPGDYRPAANASWCFCEDSWRAIEEAMWRKYKEVAGMA